MALTIRQSPSDYALAYNPQVYVASSDYADLAKYELLIELYKNNVLQDSITLNKLPLPTGYVVFDIQSIVEGYLKSDFGVTQAFETNDNSFVNVKVSLRDYGTISGWGAYVEHNYYAWNGVAETIDWNSFTQANYSNTTYFLTRSDITQSTTTTENAELYLISSSLGATRGADLIVNGSFDTDTVWSHVVQWKIDLLNSNVAVCDATFANVSYSMFQAVTGVVANDYYQCTITVDSISQGAYISLLFGTTTFIITEQGTHSLIGLAPVNNEIFYIRFIGGAIGDTCQVSFAEAKAFDVKPYSLEVKSYTSSNTLIGTKTIKNDKIGSEDKYKFLRVPAGKYNLNQVNNTLLLTGSQPLIESNCSYYTLRIKGQTGTYYATKTFNVDDSCGKYTKYRLHWLNRLGGYDSYTFDLVSRNNIDIEKKTFKKQLGGLTIQNSGAASFSYQNSDRQDSQYYTKFKNRTLITSDWLSNAESDWLSELMTSPSVFWERGSQDFVAININATTYEIKNNKVDKIFNHTLEFSLSFDEFTQNL